MPDLVGKGSKLEITPKIIDCGTRVIQVSQVTSVQIARAYPYRWIGVLLIVFAAGLVAALARYAAGFGGALLEVVDLKQLAAVAAGALVLLGLGTWLFARSRSELQIASSDGDKLRLSSPHRQFMADILHAVRDAMVAERQVPLRYVVNFTARKVEGGRMFPSLGEGLSIGPQGPVRGIPRLQERPPPPPRNVGLLPGTIHLNGNGRAHAQPAETGGARAQLQPAESANGTAKTPPPVQQMPPLPPESPRDLGALIDLVTESGVQHKETLLQLLRVVDDHVNGGRTGREDALAHWKSFSDYATGYLGEVQGLVPLTERVQRLLQKQERAQAG